MRQFDVGNYQHAYNFMRLLLGNKVLNNCFYIRNLA